MNSLRVSDVQDAFFKAMLAGYAKNGQKMKVPDMPNHWQTEFREGDLHLLDRWGKNHLSGHSAGTTTIWWKDNPIWTMNYAGFYEKSVTSFLKRTLMFAYERRQFIGGRGTHLCHDGDLLYMNQVEKGDFADFYGFEQIIDCTAHQDETRKGWHRYSGQLLL